MEQPSSSSSSSSKPKKSSKSHGSSKSKSKSSKHHKKSEEKSGGGGVFEHFGALPTELQLEIVRHVDHVMLARLACVSRSLRNLCLMEFLWAAQCHRAGYEKAHRSSFFFISFLFVFRSSSSSSSFLSSFFFFFNSVLHYSFFSLQLQVCGSPQA